MTQVDTNIVLSFVAFNK